MHSATPEISIIVPVYNAGRYLHECVESIIAQTFTDWELLLVDDGSTDGSHAICDDYAVSDSRIRAIHQPNGGVSAARNSGLDKASGQRIAFIDADDRVEPNYLEALHKPAYADITMCAFRFQHTDNQLHKQVIAISFSGKNQTFLIDIS